MLRVYIIVFAVFLSLALRAQTPYDLSFPALAAGQTITLSDYSGKKLLVVIVDAATPNGTQLRMLDSLYRQSSDSLAVVGVPANDFGEPLGDPLLYHTLRDSLGLSYPIAQTGSAGKAADNQQALLNWLTHATANDHFDQDITEAGRIYVVSEAGSLYGLLAPAVTAAEVNTALHQAITQ